MHTDTPTHNKVCNKDLGGFNVLIRKKSTMGISDSPGSCAVQIIARASVLARIIGEAVVNHAAVRSSVARSTGT